MLSLFNKTFSKNFKKTLIFLLMSIIFVWMYIGLYPSLQEKGELMKSLIGSYPESFIKAFGINSQSLFTTLEDTLAVYHYSIILPVMYIALVIGSAASFIAGEIENKTMFLLLSQPLSRSQVFFSKYLVGLLQLLIFLFGSVFITFPLALVFDIDFVAINYVYAFIVSMLLGICVYSMAFMISSFSSTRGRVSTIAGGIMFAMYTIFLFSAMNDKVDSLKYFSFFYYYDYKLAINEGQIELSRVAIFIILSLVFTFIGWFRFRQRDI